MPLPLAYVRTQARRHARAHARTYTHAHARRHTDVVELLLGDPRVDVSAIPGLALRADACEAAGNRRISQLLRAEVTASRLTPQLPQLPALTKDPSAEWEAADLGIGLSANKPARRASRVSAFESLRRTSIAAMQSLSLLTYDRPILNQAFDDIPAATGTSQDGQAATGSAPLARDN